MARRLRMRVLKWTGILACVMLACLWLVSAWYNIGWTGYLRGGEYELMLWVANGDVHANYTVYNETALSYWSRRGAKTKSGLGIAPATVRGAWWVYPHWPFEGGQVLDGTRSNSGVVWGYWRGIALPIWAPLLLMTVLTASVGWLGRARYREGYCRKCGYDLTGNVSGRCPECGRAVPE